VSLEVQRGQVQGLAGESGSGKTITGLTVIGLEPNRSEISGHIWLDGQDLLKLTGSALNAVRGAKVGMVFQDPSTSLHPQLTVGSQLTDHVRYHLKVSKDEARDRAVQALDRVGVQGGRATLARYPHEFSGGQRQRIAIAIALACDPAVLIADEPTTALDVTVQAGVLTLIRSLVDSLGLAVLFITHDLGVMSAVADRVAIMRHGQIVENGLREQVFTAPTHAYTRELLASLPGAKGGLESRADLARMFPDGGLELASPEGLEL
jgi:ABC-type dipeptide/oligopeptide/nickel transport system ATPase component